MNKPPKSVNNKDRRGGFIMKKIVGISFIIIIFLFVGCTSISNNDLLNNEKLKYEEIKNEIIRFHVLANSDSQEDQELKIKVRDAIIEHVYKGLKSSKSIEESREYLINNKEVIEGIAKEVIINSGYSYNINSTLSKENFPDKMYGDILFPQGEYEAFKILIGEGKGQNWWCVMFPPLCFVDETKETIDNYKTRENLEINEDQKMKEELEVKQESKIVFKSKILEGLKRLFF